MENELVDVDVLIPLNRRVVAEESPRSILDDVDRYR